MQKNTSVKLAALRRALQEGENSGLAEYFLSGLLEELDREQSIYRSPRNAEIG